VNTRGSGRKDSPYSKEKSLLSPQYSRCPKNCFEGRDFSAYSEGEPGGVSCTKWQGWGGFAFNNRKGASRGRRKKNTESWVQAWPLWLNLDSCLKASPYKRMGKDRGQETVAGWNVSFPKRMCCKTKLDIFIAKISLNRGGKKRLVTVQNKKKCTEKHRGGTCAV